MNNCEKIEELTSGISKLQVKVNPYNHSRVYKLVSKNSELIYIGSTCNPLAKRLGQHRCDYKRFVNDVSTKKCTAFEVLEKGDCDIILLELVNVDTKELLHARERYWIENLDCVNKRVAGRGKQERNKNYYNQNREQISIKKSIKYVCSCGGKYTHSHLLSHCRTKKHLAFEKNSQDSEELTPDSPDLSDD